MRLIDADKLLSDYQELADCDFVHPLYENTLRDIIDDAPTVEVCEDCVSRADVLGLAKKGVLVSNNNYQAVCKAINELPSVTPSYNSINTELKPCEDCISRTQALNEINKKVLCYTYEARKIIEKLPSVTPHRFGKWTKTMGEINGFGDWGEVYKCSCCDKTTLYPEKFCPNCGAEMRGDRG